MLVLGLQGSPRGKGNTNKLLAAFMDETDKLGAQAITIDLSKKNILPCDGSRFCEKKGSCAINDDMSNEIYSLFRRAELIVMATPVFFYSVPAQLKAVIDRSQALWSRRYMLKLEDTGRKWRKGFLLALGATRGANLFEGLSLTAKYFFDAVGAGFNGSLTYRRVENPGDIDAHPTAIMDAKKKAEELVKPLLNRKKIIFVCRENACRSQMSAAFAQMHAGDRLEVISAGDKPAHSTNKIMEEVMAENGIDMAFKKPQSIVDATRYSKPDIVVTMGCEVSCPVFPGAETIDWDLPDPAERSKEFMRELRDKIEEKILDLIKSL